MRNQNNSRELKARIGNLVQPYVYGEGDETLEEIVGKMLRKFGWTLALADVLQPGVLSAIESLGYPVAPIILRVPPLPTPMRQKWLYWESRKPR